MIKCIVLALAMSFAIATGAFAQSGTYVQPVVGKFYNSVPTSFTPCANDFHNCNLNAPSTALVNVFYGAEGKYILAQGQGNFSCQPSTFGISDPVPNVKKACWVFANYFGSSDANPAGSPNQTFVTSVPATAQSCAVDFAQCNVNGMWFGYYGVNNTFVNISGSGSFTCLPGTFGVSDPAAGIQKTCYITRVVFSSFSFTESPSFASLVPGITLNYQAVSGSGTEIWDAAYTNMKPGTPINNLSSIAPLAFVVSFIPLPSNYSITLYGGTSPGPISSGIAFQFPNNISVTSSTPMAGTVKYVVTPPSATAQGNIAQPVLTY